MNKNFLGKQYASVTAVAHKLAKNAPSGLDARGVAEYLGVNYQTFMSELSGQPGHKWGADNILPLSDAADSDALIVFLARQRGGVFVKLPEADVPGCEELLKPLGEAVRDFGQWMETASDHMADGKLEPHELAEFDRRSDELMEQIVKAKKTYHHIYETQNGDGK